MLGFIRVRQLAEVFSHQDARRTRRPRSSAARRREQVGLTQPEGRTLPSSFTASTVSDRIADINAANKHGGTNSITLTAPTTSPYVWPISTALTSFRIAEITPGIVWAPSARPEYNARPRTAGLISNSERLQRLTGAHDEGF
jgi:hypothetical protein